MEIIKTFSNEKEGTGCRFVNDIALVKLCGDYVVLESQKILFRDGWHESVYTTNIHDKSGNCYEHAETVYNALVKAHEE